MKDSKIRWTDDTWNAVTGCEEISPGCDNCYARVIAEKFRGTAFPRGFEPHYKPHKLDEPRRKRAPSRFFVNSLSDMHLPAWTTDQIDSMYDVMAETPKHDFLVLTKRPQRMASYFLGTADQPGWLERRGLDAVPPQIWLGTTIELDKYAFRADHLRRIPATVRFVSAEPLLGPLPSLDLNGISWVIVGGESGNNSSNFRPMDLAWATDLWHRCQAAGVAFFGKQDSGRRTELNPGFLGELVEEFPFDHPVTHSGDRQLGVWPFAHRPTAVTIPA